MADASIWNGRAFSENGKIRYGKVSFKVKGNGVLDFEIDGVPTYSGCNGFRPVAVDKKIRIKSSGVFYKEYVPLPGYNDTIYVWGKIKGSSARGYFRTFGLCPSVGIFKASRG